MQLNQPPGNPPAYIFAPVWGLLYAGMGYASHRAWTAGVNSFEPTTAIDAKVCTQQTLSPKPKRIPIAPPNVKPLYLPQADTNLRKHGATLYTVQLGLNLMWMPLFFGFQRPIEATADLVALLGVTGYLTYLWSGIDSAAAWAMVPYLGWLGYATYLSVSAFRTAGSGVRVMC